MELKNLQNSLFLHLNNKMLIAIDGVAANDLKRVGVSVYTFELLKYFYEKASNELQFVVYLKDQPRNDLPVENENFCYRVVPGPFLWSRIFFPLALMIDKKPDVFFAPAHYLPPFVPCPSVVTIHDLAYEYFPEEFLKTDLYKLQNWTKDAVKKAVKVIAVSNNTKADVLKSYGVPDNKVKVIYNGLSNRLQETSNKKQTNFKFILYVGTLQPRKNITGLIEAFNLLIQEKPEYKLVIAGKKGWLYDEIFQKVKDLKLKDKVIFTGYVSDSKLINLYQNASVLVLPSLYEGFGLPILEAMSFGCPVATSNVSSLTEIGGDACLYFDPNDKIEIKNKIARLLDNEALKNELIAKGRERIKQFSWHKCGKKTLEILIESSDVDKPSTL